MAQKALKNSICDVIATDAYNHDTRICRMKEYEEVSKSAVDTRNMESMYEYSGGHSKSNS